MTTPTADEQGWRPIAEAPPYEWLLLSCGRGGIIEALFCNDAAGQEMRWMDSNGKTVYGAEYWIPLDALPSPPTSGEGA